MSDRKEQVLKSVREKLADAKSARQERTYNEAGEMIKDWHEPKRS